MNYIELWVLPLEDNVWVNWQQLSGFTMFHLELADGFLFESTRNQVSSPQLLLNGLQPSPLSRPGEVEMPTQELPVRPGPQEPQPWIIWICRYCCINIVSPGISLIDPSQVKMRQRVLELWGLPRFGKYSRIMRLTIKLYMSTVPFWLVIMKDSWCNRLLVLSSTLCFRKWDESSLYTYLIVIISVKHPLPH